MIIIIIIIIIIIAEAVGAMWTLSFDDENRKIMMEDKKLDILMVLAELRDSDSEKIRSAADGALWNLRDDLRTPKTKKYQARGIITAFKLSP